MARASTPAIVTIGESMVLVAPAHAEPLADAVDVRLDVGGAESNVAAHIAQMGHHSAWVSDVGDDALGHRLLSTLRQREVDLSFTAFGDGPTGVYFKDPGHGVHYYRAGSAASRMSARTLTRVPFDDIKRVHISGITPALSASCMELIEAVVERCAEAGPQLSFDVNYRGALWPVEAASPVLKRIAARSHTVFVGRDEAEVIWGTADADQIRALIPQPRRLVVKDADIGATEYSSEGRTFVPSIPCRVVEPIGAGDAFAAGYLAADIEGAGPEERIRRGHERAVLTLASTADVPEIERSTHADA